MFFRISLVDELEVYKEILIIISLLSSENVSIQVEAKDYRLGIANYRRREAIEAMLPIELVKKLMELHRVENQYNGIENETVIQKSKVKSGAIWGIFLLKVVL
ncbi:hypothetical protein DITRI_Ditri03aG0014700 [Diplodiscus trichospermus]